jgi:hypothetical protein
MKRMFIVIIFGIFMATGMCADTPPNTEGPSAPRLASPNWPPSQFWVTMARLNEEGKVFLEFQTTRSVPLTATRVLRDGKEVKEKHTFYTWETSWVDQTYDPKDIKLLGSDGKPLDKKKFPEILKKERPVVILYDDKIDSTFLKVIKEGTPILVLPFQEPS